MVQNFLKHFLFSLVALQANFQITQIINKLSNQEIFAEEKEVLKFL